MFGTGDDGAISQLLTSNMVGNGSLCVELLLLLLSSYMSSFTTDDPANAAAAPPPEPPQPPQFETISHHLHGWLVERLVTRDTGHYRQQHTWIFRCADTASQTMCNPRRFLSCVPCPGDLRDGVIVSTSAQVVLKAAFGAAGE